MNATLLLQLLLLLVLVNGAPILARGLLGERGAWPLDGGRRWRDGRPWLGASKTVRGLVSALLAGTLAAPLLGLDGLTGLALGAGAMAGDLLSSFTKRRLGIPPSGMALGLDQIPESLLPLLLVKARTGLDYADIALAVLAFVVLELTLSRLLYRLRIRERPY